MQFLKFGGGRRFYAKDFRNAYHFRPDVAPPRQKFQGYINFVPNRALLSTFLGLEDSLNLRTRLSSLIRTAQLPEVTINTEVKNSFNRKRIITTGREYAPINLTLFDTIQNEWLTVLMKYFTYNFRDATNKMSVSQTPNQNLPAEREPSTQYTIQAGDTLSSIASANNSTVEEIAQENGIADPNVIQAGQVITIPGAITGPGMETTLETKRDLFFEINNDSLLAYNTETTHGTDSSKKGFDSDAFGYSPSYHKNFFERIDIILYHGNKGVQYTLVNPTITTINFGDIDYSDSGFKDFNLSIAYEYFTVVDQLNFNLGEADLSRFERMDGVKLPGSRNAKQPTALNGTSIEPIMTRPRASQVLTQFEEGDTDLSQQLSNISTTYNGYVGAGDSGPQSFLEAASGFLEDNPFGRILDRGLSAAINGGDVKDALLGGITNEVVAGITSPNDDTIFGPDVNYQFDPGNAVTGGINSAANFLGWRPDSGTDNQDGGDGGNTGGGGT